MYYNSGETSVAPQAFQGGIMTKQAVKTERKKQTKPASEGSAKLADDRISNVNGACSQAVKCLIDYKDSPYKGKNPKAYYATIVGIGID